MGGGRGQATRLSAGLLAGLLVIGGTSAAAGQDAQSGAQHTPRDNPWDRGLGTTARLGSDDPVDTAVDISRARFQDDRAAHVVLTRDDAFPDALAGTPLVGDGPMLLTNRQVLDGRAKQELDRVLPEGGRVYLLGGTAAMSADIESGLAGDGYEIRRLSGPSRYETAVAIADEVTALYGNSGKVLVARAWGTPTNATAGFADSVTGGGWAARNRVPVVLSDTAALTPVTGAWLDGKAEAILLGGTAALSAEVESQVDARAGAVRRVKGAARDGTAVAIATDLWGKPPGQGRFAVVNGYADDGFAYGLPAAGLSADFDAPLLVAAANALPEQTAAIVSANDVKSVQTLVVGGPSAISENVRTAIEARDACSGCTSNPAAPRLGDGELVLARLLPHSTPAAHFATSASTAVDLALADLDAEGIPGLSVRLIDGDTAGDPGTASSEIDRLVSAGAELFVGPMFSRVATEAIGDFDRHRVPACSPSTTLSHLSDAEAEVPGFWFRSAASDELQAEALVQHLASQGHTKVSLLYAADVGGDYANLLPAAARQHGVTVTATIEINEDSTDEERASQAVSSGASGHIVVATSGAHGAINALVGAGVDVGDILGNEFVLTSDVDPDGAFDGLQAIGQRENGFPGFSERFAAFAPDAPEAFAAHAYDCAVVGVLAAVVAGSDTPADIAAAMVEVTRGGQVCTTVRTCLDLAAAGADLDYDGASGRLEWDDTGESTVASFVAYAYAGGEAVQTSVIEVS